MRDWRMATLRLSQNFSGNSLGDFFSNFLTTSDITSTNAFFTAGGDAAFNMQGTGFNDQENSVAGGTATSVTFYGYGQTIATLTGLNYDTSDVRLGARGSWVLADMMSGNDTVVGSDNGDILESYGGRDVLRGYAGKDVLDGGRNADLLIGGAGSDKFEIGLGRGNDVIKDFDAAGGGNLQDYLVYSGNFDDLRIVKDGDDTIVIIPSGPRITLHDVAPAQIDAGDFII
jgi:Ca2+-binding RTX toxin-like protein